MKPGDKVWFFDGERILSMTIETIKSDAIYGNNKAELKDGREIGRTIYRIEKPHPVFPSREALCEHYRKIFE